MIRRTKQKNKNNNNKKLNEATISYKKSLNYQYKYTWTTKTLHKKRRIQKMLLVSAVTLWNKKQKQKKQSAGKNVGTNWWKGGVVQWSGTWSVNYASGLRPILFIMRWSIIITSPPKDAEWPLRASKTSSSPNNPCQTSAVSPASNLSWWQTTATPCSGRRQRHPEVLCHWRRCTKTGCQRLRCWLHCHRNPQITQGSCGWVCPL